MAHRAARRPAGNSHIKNTIITAISNLVVVSFWLRCLWLAWNLAIWMGGRAPIDWPRWVCLTAMSARVLSLALLSVLLFWPFMNLQMLFVFRWTGEYRCKNEWELVWVSGRERITYIRVESLVDEHWRSGSLLTTCFESSSSSREFKPPLVEADLGDWGLRGEGAKLKHCSWFSFGWPWKLSFDCCLLRTAVIETARLELFRLSFPLFGSPT